jgi:putative endonuclease
MPNNINPNIDLLPSTQQIGQQKENQVCDHLISQGLQLIMQNYRCKLGEIDLIMKDKDTLVFIEVRHRKQNDYGNGLESITKTKQRKIIRTAQHYLQTHELDNKFSCRFDAVITGQTTSQQFLWIKDAFWVK